jgi:hypothetical protein
MLTTRQNQVFEDYVAAVHKRMQQDGKIKIYNDVLAQIDAAQQPEIAPRPQIPFPQ